jgi:hypothetical protein
MSPVSVNASVLAKILHAMGWQCRAAALAFSNTVKEPCPYCEDSSHKLIAGLAAAGFTFVAGGERTSARALAVLSKTMHDQGGWNNQPPYLGPPYHDACEGWAKMVVEELGQVGYCLRAQS